MVVGRWKKIAMFIYTCVKKPKYRWKISIFEFKIYFQTIKRKANQARKQIENKFEHFSGNSKCQQMGAKKRPTVIGSKLEEDQHQKIGKKGKIGKTRGDEEDSGRKWQ